MNFKRSVAEKVHGNRGVEVTDLRCVKFAGEEQAQVAERLRDPELAAAVSVLIQGFRKALPDDIGLQVMAYVVRQVIR